MLVQQKQKSTVLAVNSTLKETEYNGYIAKSADIFS